MRMKMWLLWLLLFGLLCLCIPKPIISATANQSIEMPGPIAKPGCQDKCGKISIPYPFGIGDVKCAKDHKFLLNCINNSRLLLLGSIPVCNISLQGTVTVTMMTEQQRFSNDDYLEETFYGRIDLKGSPFMFSTRNKLVVFGCNVTAFIISDHQYWRGCFSFCNGSDQQLDCCAGIGCCQISIPKRLTVLNFTVQSMTTESFNHGIDILALNAKSPSNIAGVNVSKHTKHPLPSEVILDWVAGDETCQAARNGSVTYACGENSACINSINGPGYRCCCKKGFWGNPYLPQGCQDINECHYPSRYPCEGSCHNTVGDYTCTKDDGTQVSSRRHGGKILALAIFRSMGILFSIVGIYWLYQLMKKKKINKLKKKYFKSNGGLLLQQQISSDKGKLEKLKIFSSEELEKATDYYNENRIVGQGGQGIVYKGMLPNGCVVAVKKSKKMDQAQIERFINEVVILSQINHRHVVKLFGCSLETEVPLLVYEFFSNGTLSNHIHDQMGEFPMKWSDRLRIAKEVAGAIAYMHSATNVPIYHRDIKSSNILLDGKYKAKLSDFGISRYVPNEKTHLITCVQGTFGYLDPEYFRTRQYTEKSDVYSFGVVLVELLTGQTPISSDRSEDLGLVAHFISSTKENCLFDVLDPQVVIDEEKEELIALANLAMRCLKLNGRKRPTMKEVSLELENLKRPQEHLSSELDHQEEDCSIMESSASLDPSDEDWDESGEIREKGWKIDISSKSY